MEITFDDGGITGFRMWKTRSAYLDENFEPTPWAPIGQHKNARENCSVRGLGCAGKLGFTKVKRDKGAYIVDGREYDGLVLEKYI